MASQAGATTGAAAETAASTADNGFNANLMLAKIGDTSFRLGDMSQGRHGLRTHDREETRERGGESRRGGSAVWAESSAASRPVALISRRR